MIDLYEELKYINYVLEKYKKDDLIKLEVSEEKLNFYKKNIKFINLLCTVINTKESSLTIKKTK